MSTARTPLWKHCIPGLSTRRGQPTVCKKPEQLLVGNGSVSHKQAIDKATGEYRKYKARTLSEVEQDYLDSIKLLEQKTDKK